MQASTRHLELTQLQARVAPQVEEYEGELAAEKQKNSELETALQATKDALADAEGKVLEGLGMPSIHIYIYVHTHTHTHTH